MTWPLSGSEAGVDFIRAKAVKLGSWTNILHTARIGMSLCVANIFQATMDNILQGVEKCVCNQDDIFIGGVNNNNNNNNNNLY